MDDYFYSYCSFVENEVSLNARKETRDDAPQNTPFRLVINYSNYTRSNTKKDMLFLSYFSFFFLPFYNAESFVKITLGT